LQIFPASFVLMAIWLIVMLRMRGGGYALTLAMLPFGMFAAISFPALGGLSLPAATFLAAIMTAVSMIEYASNLKRAGPPILRPATLAFGIFTAYGVFSAFVLVRLFQGQFMVFPLARGRAGVRVDVDFPSTQSPIWPSSANISQTFYILIAFGFFVTMCRWLRARGLNAGEVALAWAAGINIILGIMDILKLDAILTYVRTASYSLHNEQTMAGFNRVIGGFAEPAIFGAASAVFFAYFFASWCQSGRLRDALLGLGNGIFVVLTFSSTGLGAMAVVIALISLRIVTGGGVSLSRTNATIAAASLFSGVAFIALLLAVTPLLDTATELLDRLFFSKLDSLSGRERSAWAASGIEAFVKTWGLGAGVGSLRSNGLVPVLLGNVGLPGLLAFIAFLWFTIGQSAARIVDPEARRILSCARLGAVALLTSMMLSATVTDPSIMLIVCCAMATVARETGAVLAPQSQHGGAEIPDLR
jgi:hypothetical protein